MQANITKTKHRFGQLVLAFMLGAGVAAAPVTLHASNSTDSGIFEFQQKLAKGGNAIAQYQLAVMYETGRGVAKDINKAREWYKKSAAGKYTPAKHRLVYLEVKTSGFKPSHKSWLNSLSTDAKRGDPEAMFMLGEMYENGTGVKKDLARAQSYYKSSSARGHIDAENRLYSVEQKLAQQNKADEAARQQATKKKQADKERKAKQAAVAREKARADQARQKQLKAEQERRRLEAERRRLAEERAKLDAQRRALEAQKAAEAKAAAQPAPAAENDDRFESDLCKGKAARFRTQCN